MDTWHQKLVTINVHVMNYSYRAGEIQQPSYQVHLPLPSLSPSLCQSLLGSHAPVKVGVI